MKCCNLMTSEWLIANSKTNSRMAKIPLFRHSLFAIRYSRPLRAILLLTPALFAGARPTRAEDPQAARITPVVRVFQQASPAVVNISSTTIVSYRPSFGGGGMDDIFDFPFAAPRNYKATSVGSGFVIHQDGYVVTNAHVVARTVERKVAFADGTELPAEIIALDAEHDLAVLKVDAPKPLPFLHLGHSNDLMPGETVVAIGNPLGLKHTVTTGIVSALDRELVFDRNRVYKGLIQTDASINPGNSGGPLLNIVGDLIGINTAIRGDAQNIGFAIPVDRLHDLLPGMLDVERLRRVELGAKFGPTVEEGKTRGVRVARVDHGGPTEKAGLKAGDLVTAVNAQPTRNFMDAFIALEKAPLGKSVDLTVLRDGDKHKNVKFTLSEAPKPDGGDLMWKRFGIRVRELTAADLRKMGLRSAVALIVTDVRGNSQAAGEGLQPGDLITKLGGRPTGTLEQAGGLLQDVSPGDIIGVGVMRIGGDAMIQVELALKAMP